MIEIYFNISSSSYTFNILQSPGEHFVWYDLFDIGVISQSFQAIRLFASDLKITATIRTI